MIFNILKNDLILGPVFYLKKLAVYKVFVVGAADKRVSSINLAHELVAQSAF